MLKVNFKNLKNKNFEAPSKNSNSNAIESFKEETNFQSQVLNNKKYSDVIRSFRYFNQHYGKLNDSRMAVLPNEKYLLTISGKESINLLSFVARSYNDFLLNLELLKAKNSISKKSKLYNFNPTKEYPTFEEKALKNSELQYSYLLDFIKNNKYDKDIKDIETFIKIFTKFVDRITPDISITNSSFLVSSSCSRKISRLVIDHDTGSENNQEQTWEEYYNSTDFDCYVELARNHGFYINKDAPWQLIANLDSNRMKYNFKLVMDIYKNQKIIEENPIKTEGKTYEECLDALESFDLRNYLFNKSDFYQIVAKNDIENLKAIIIQMYNSFVDYSPYTVVTEAKKKNEKLVTVKKFIPRTPINFEEALSDNSYKWLYLYVFIKGREVNASWSQQDFLNISQKAYQINSSLDTTAMVEYVNSEILDRPRSPLLMRNFSY